MVSDYIFTCLEKCVVTFINEITSDEDVKKFGLEEIDKKYRHLTFRSGWTIDRERNIYLRKVESGREEYANQAGFTLYWKGTLIYVALSSKGGGERGGAGWTEWTLRSINIPAELQDKREVIIADLKEALTAYKDFGAYSATTTHAGLFKF